MQAAQAADKAAQAVESALAQEQSLEAAVRHARDARTAIAQTWAAAFDALKRGARAAADDGAPQLYAALFERAPKPGKSTKSGAAIATASPVSADAGAQANQPSPIPAS